MSSPRDWEASPQVSPKPEDYAFDFERTLTAVLGLKALVPADAFTAGILGTERGGNAAQIREDGLVLTMGYLITEVETVWLSTADGRAVPGHALAYDQETGFGLVQALGRLSGSALPLAAYRGGKVLQILIQSADRASFLKAPRLH